jgi:hypothetical protein
MLEHRRMRRRNSCNDADTLLSLDETAHLFALVYQDILNYIIPAKLTFEPQPAARNEAVFTCSSGDVSCTIRIQVDGISSTVRWIITQDGKEVCCERPGTEAEEIFSEIVGLFGVPTERVREILASL